MIRIALARHPAVDAVVSAVPPDLHRPIAVAHTQRFDPLFGALRVVAIDQRLDPGARAWTDAPGRGGALLVTGVHAFDLARWRTGAEPVSVVAETSAAPGRATEDTFAAVLRFEPGDVVVTIDNCHRSHGRSGRVSVAGASGQLAVDHVTRCFVMADASGETDLGCVPREPDAPQRSASTTVSPR